MSADLDPYETKVFEKFEKEVYMREGCYFPNPYLNPLHSKATLSIGSILVSFPFFRFIFRSSKSSTSIKTAKIIGASLLNG